MDVASVRFPPGAKSISPDMSPTELVKSLKRCCKFFSQLEQDQEEEKKMYKPFCLHIAESDFVYEITDANARIHLGCIFADIFRLHAPENPFPADKTKEIFLFLANQLQHLQNTKSPLYSKAYHILENISAVKSFNICLELDSASTDEILIDLFRNFFSIVNSSHDAQVKNLMLDVLVCVIAEVESLSQRVFDIILECLLVKCQKMNPSAYELARELLRKTSQNLEGVVMLFFQNSLLGDPNEMNALMKNWPRLLSELRKVSDSFFMIVAPQLELKLRTDNLNERIQVVRLLSRMFSDKDSDLPAKHPSLWTSFLARFNDIQPEVRSECVNFCSAMIVNHVDDNPAGQKLFSELLELLKLRRHDPDEGVRVAVIVSIRSIAMQSPGLVSDDLLVFLRERLFDKKYKVRETAIKAAADVYKKFLSFSNSALYRAKMRMLQSQLLRVYYTQNFDDCILIERMFVSSLVQYSLPDGERMRRLLQLYSTVDDHAIKAIAEMFNKQKTLRHHLNSIVGALHLDDNERNQKLWPGIMAVSTHLQSPAQSREHVKKFVAMTCNDDSLVKLLEYLVADKYTSQKVALTVRDILKKLDQEKITNKTFRQTVQQLLERSVLVTILLDPASVMNLAELVDELQKGTSKVEDVEIETAKKKGMDLLVMLAKHDPNLFTESDCLELFLGMLRVKDSYIVEKTLLIFLSTATVIEEKYKVIRSILIPELKAIAQSGPPSHAKYSIRCLNLFTSVREAPLIQVFHQCKESASESLAPGVKLRTLLTTLGCVAECLPEQAGKEMKGFIASVVVKKIIMQTNVRNSKKKELRWCEKSNLSEETQTKLTALKCMTRWLCGLKSNESDCCGSTLRLLQHMIHNDGDLMKCGHIPKSEMAHLRLQAAFCVLKIASCREYKDLISTTILTELTALLMDEVFQVQTGLLNKLYRSLYHFKIHISFMSLFWVLSQEKVKEHRNHGMTMYRNLVTRYRTLSKDKPMHSIVPEFALSFAIHLIASDPAIPPKDDIPKSVLSRMKDSLNFILDPLLTRDHPESFGFIKRLAEMIKRTKLQDDAENQMRSKTLYKVCDLVLQTVLVKSGQYAIGIIEPPDEAVKKFLPSRLYTRLNSEENRHNYLPEAFHVEHRPVPIRITTASNQSAKNKFPRKLVAVTKVALPSQSEASSANDSEAQCTASSVSKSSKVKKSATRPPKKRKPVEYSSSDEESLASKKSRIEKSKRKTVKEKDEETDNASSQNSSILEVPQSDYSAIPSSPATSTSSSSRPKRASAGSKMQDYLNSMKRTPTKSKSDSASNKSTPKRTVKGRKKKT